MAMPEPEGNAARNLPLWQRLVIELAQMLRFYSRLPVPKLPFETAPHAPPDFSRATRILPLAALIIALPGTLILWLGTFFWLPALLVALLSLAMTVMLTGALHEDGLADFADGIGGGTSKEQRLEIMRDSRIGSNGAVALILVLAAKIIAIAALLDRHATAATMLALLAAAMVSRAAAILPHWLLLPARADGRSASVGQPGTGAALTAICQTLVITVFCLHGFGWMTILVALTLAGMSSLFITHLARTRLGGHTGDVMGAAQQVTELAFLIGLNASFYR